MSMLDAVSGATENVSLVSKVAKKLQLGGKISLVSKAEDQPGGS